MLMLLITGDLAPSLCFKGENTTEMKAKLC